MDPAPLHGFAFWFDVEFGGPVNLLTNNGTPSDDKTINRNCDNGGQRKRRTNPSEGLILSTAPEDPPTHWQQVFSFSILPLFFFSGHGGGCIGWKLAFKLLSKSCNVE